VKQQTTLNLDSQQPIKKEQTTTSATTGSDGVGLPVGGTAGQIPAKVSGTDFDIDWIDPPSGGNTFETVSKNLNAIDATLAYSGGNLTTITYASGIIKTLNYSGGNLTSIVLSGSTPGGIDLTKTLSYTGSDLTGIAYS
jgi:hypothetical protein